MSGARRSFLSLAGLALAMALGAPLPSLRAAAVDVVAADTGEFDEYDEYALPQTYDPWEKYNRTIFKFNGTVNTYVFIPVSKGYRTVVPSKARKGIGSFFDNLAFPLRFVGCLLQGKFERSAAETGKFLLNSTVGLGGFIKVSDHVPELRVPEEDLGQAFGAWGIGHGPYLVLPILGPSSLRDGAGRFLAYPLNPLQWEFAESFDWRVRDGLNALEVVNSLPDKLDNLDRITRSAVDPYIAVRNGYIQYRNAAVKQ